MWSDDKQEQKRHGHKGEDWLHSPDGSSTPGNDVRRNPENLRWTRRRLVLQSVAIRETSHSTLDLVIAAPFLP